MNEYYQYNEFIGRDDETWYVLKWVDASGRAHSTIKPLSQQTSADMTIKNDMATTPENFPKPSVFTVG